jgi:hypothetical protein
VKRYKSATILGGGPPGKIVQCQSLAPLAGLGTSYKYVQAAQGAMEKRARIATVASF